MDLLATVRKEGSRGGRGEFKWSDVQGSSHRENYLGHSLMAPVGRWQKGRDLNWYSKTESDGDGEDAAERAARERRDEIRRVKEAEEDAMAKALGLPVPDRNNANLQELGPGRDFDKVLKEAVHDESEGGKGVGFDGTRGTAKSSQVLGERIEGNAEAQDKELQYALREYRRRHRDHDRQRSRSRDRERRHQKRERPRERRDGGRHTEPSDAKRQHRRRRSVSPLRSRSRSGSRSRDREDRKRRRPRSRSPVRRDRENDRSERRRRYD